jgi:hypothetical protein
MMNYYKIYSENILNDTGTPVLKSLTCERTGNELKNE